MFTSHYERPLWQLSLDGQDLSQLINPRLMALTLTESREQEADQLSLTLSDHDGLLALPSRGAVIRLAIGWPSTGLIDKGTFTVDEVSHRGAPDELSLRARSADLTSPLRQRSNRSFHQQTLKQIIDTVAQANGLTAVVDKVFKLQKIDHIDQTDETDAAFLQRIGKRYDAVATVKEKRLLFMSIVGTKTASGQALPIMTLSRRDGDSHEFLMTSRDTYTGVRAFWMNPKKAMKHSVLVGVKGNAKQLRETFANEADALSAAQSEWQRICRGLATLSFKAAIGRPELSVQHRLRLTELKPPISEINWLVKQLTHHLNQNGFTTDIECEKFEDGK